MRKQTMIVLIPALLIAMAGCAQQDGSSNPQGELTRPLALKILNEQLAQPHINVLIFNDNGIQLAKQDGILEDNPGWPPGSRFTAKGLSMVQAVITKNMIYFNGSDARCGLKAPIGERVIEVTGIAPAQMPGVSVVEYTTEYLLPAEMQQIKAYCSDVCTLFVNLPSTVVKRHFW